MKNKYLFLIISLLSCFTSAKAVEICGTAKQGEILIGKIDPNQKAIFNDEELMVTDDGFFLLAFGRDEINSQSLQVMSTNLSGEQSYKFAVALTEWDIQNIKGVPPRKVTPPDSDLAAIEKERKIVRASLKEVKNNIYWKSGFIRPVEGRISGKFGGQRIMNGVPKNPHQGMDIAAKEGLPVKASADGEIVLAYPDLFYSGNTVVIDHGHGLQTIYAHLKEMKVKRGDIVKQGDIIGTVGQTGRATGPHLHWGASLRNVRFNPQSLLDMNNKQQNCFTL